MKKHSIEKWFQQEAQKSGLPQSQVARTPQYQKWLAFALVLGIPVTVSGCSSELTAQDDCQWEKEHGHQEIRCDNSSTSHSGSGSSWYRSRGYTSPNDPIHPTSPNYDAIHAAKGTAKFQLVDSILPRTGASRANRL